LSKLEDILKEPFSKYFVVEGDISEYQNRYSYLPEILNSEIKNPIGAKPGDERQITIFQVAFRKK